MAYSQGGELVFSGNSLIVVYPTAVNKVLYVSAVDTNYSDINITAKDLKNYQKSVK